MTSQAFRNALHVPLSDPGSGNVIAVQDPGGDWYPTAWGDASGLPEAPIDGVQYARKDGVWVEVDMAAIDILNHLKTVDGSGSGLDADFLDGQNSSTFATVAYVDALIVDMGTY